MEKLHVLCVDDQREVLLSITRDLEPLAEWTVVEECESADEALELMAELEEHGAPLALIVCDHIMPGMLGVDFLAAVERSGRHPHAKKALITGQATHADTINAINFAKIDAYIEKPWKSEDLRALCRRLLTEYLFDARMDADAYRRHADPEVLLRRAQGRE